MPLFQLQDNLLAVEFVGSAQEEEPDRDFALARVFGSEVEHKLVAV